MKTIKFIKEEIQKYTYTVEIDDMDYLELKQKIQEGDITNEDTLSEYLLNKNQYKMERDQYYVDKLFDKKELEEIFVDAKNSPYLCVSQLKNIHNDKETTTNRIK